MTLTALEIKQQKFERSLRGFDPTEVSAFLSIVSREWEHMVTQNRELEEKIRELNQKLDHYRKVEEALHETLQTAKKTAEQRLDEVKNEVRNRIRKAELDADAIINDAQQQRQGIRQSILRLLDRRGEIIRGVRSYLELAQESLKSFENDDARVFDLPKEEAGRQVDEEFKTAEASETDASRKPGEKHRAVVPGVDDLDDIIDEIE